MTMPFTIPITDQKITEQKVYDLASFLELYRTDAPKSVVFYKRCGDVTAISGSDGIIRMTPWSGDVLSFLDRRSGIIWSCEINDFNVVDTSCYFSGMPSPIYLLRALGIVAIEGKLSKEYLEKAVAAIQPKDKK